MKTSHLFPHIFLTVFFAANSLFATTVVYVSESKDNRIAVFSLDEQTGELTRNSQIDLEGTPGCLAISADQKHLYASNRGHDSIAAFEVDSDSGELTALGRTPTEKTPRSFNLIPGGKQEKFLVSAGQGSNTLIVYRRNPTTGSLRALKQYNCGQSPAWVLGVRLD